MTNPVLTIAGVMPGPNDEAIYVVASACG